MGYVAKVVSAGPDTGVRPGLTAAPRPAARHETEPEDQELLRRCVAGDGQAWAQIVGRYERLVFSVALKNGVSREDAADITQLTFVALLDSIGRLRSDSSLPSWLMTVARRQAWRVRRRTARELPWPTDLVDSGTASEDYERVAVLHAGLAQLGTRCRQLLYALFFDPDAPPYAVIADRLQCAVGTIGPQRARCLQRLRVLLDDEETTE